MPEEGTRGAKRKNGKKKQSVTVATTKCLSVTGDMKQEEENGKIM
jgi:hypothetical protein